MSELGETLPRAHPGPRAERPSRRKLGRFRTPRSHRFVEYLLAAMALSSVAAIALIFLFIGREAVPLFWEEAALEELGGWAGLFLPQEWRGYEEATHVWQPVGYPGKFSLLPLFVGTIKVTVLTMLISVPLGVGAAIYLSQYAPRRLRNIVKPIIELLGGVPSVVIGFFALVVLASWMQGVTGATYRLNGLVAAVGLTLTVVPIVTTISEDALQAVPRSLVEGALALGARRYQVIARVVLPAAVPGIAAAVVLGFGRAIGETMIVLMASGNAAVIELFDPTSSVRTVTATIAAELGEVSRGDAHWRVLFLLGTLLFLVTFALNKIGRTVTQRLEARFTAAEARR